ncbi:hypothetical protein GUJ93_ZPchr0001g30979 [Zizania palustris]|uniref:Uncharacterized protein n=1 Tax=Zizania palustris TaxID=103762 RepID=A0A8J5VQJ3_ZIZPA|nr:hypothetical protein GUJ93_ZPchr0001g30979 [Zizania palustris]
MVKLWQANLNGVWNLTVSRLEQGGGRMELRGGRRPGWGGPVTVYGLLTVYGYCLLTSDLLLSVSPLRLLRRYKGVIAARS